MNTSKTIFKYDVEIPSTYKEFFENVCRDHLISEYIDETLNKTQELLEKSHGKVIIIEEAYTLSNDNSNMFDSEYLQKLNEYLEQGIVDTRRSKFYDWLIISQFDHEKITHTTFNEDSSTDDNSLNTFRLSD